MGLFDSVEIDGEVIPYIRNGEGIGVVKIDDYGECSVRIENGTIIVKSYDTSSVVLQLPLIDITSISYDKGNFIQEPKINIVLQKGNYTLKGVDDNDKEVEHFYNTLINIKEGNQPQANTQQGGMPHPNSNITNPNKMPQNNVPPSPQAPPNPQSQPPQQNMQQNMQQDVPQDMQQDVQQQGFDPIDEIKRYHELLEEGIITEEEFAKKKEELLKL